MFYLQQVQTDDNASLPYLSYLTSGMGRLLHLPSAEAVSARPNAHMTMYMSTEKRQTEKHT